jgi:hypothetical protein
MKLYIYRSKNLKIKKETTIQSILSDLFTYGFFAVLYGGGIAFEYFIGRSWLIELSIFLLSFLWIFGKGGMEMKEVSKEELIEIIKGL